MSKYNPQTDLRICDRTDVCVHKNICPHAQRHRFNSQNEPCYYPVAIFCHNGSAPSLRQLDGLWSICTKRIYSGGKELDL